MLSGTLLIVGVLGFAELSIIFSIVSINKKNRDTAKILTNITYLISTLFIFTASFLLFYFLIKNRFDISYVYSYTVKEQPLVYTISAFWAGRQGSILLWLLLSSIMGTVILLKNYKENEILMGFFNLIHIFFAIMLLVNNPFDHTWEIVDGLEVGQIPENGSGMNPAFINPWMIIHPPILFLGYAAAFIPMAFAVAGVIKRKYNQVINSSFPWTVFAVMVLGLGNILGSYWAYVILGWGGFWGWDPVENSSLIPWFFLLALLHMILYYRVRKSHKWFIIFLMMISYVLVIWGTFSTRSGIFASISQHSFEGSPTKNILLAFLVQAILLTVGLLIFSASQHKNELRKGYSKIQNNDSDSTSLSLFSRANLLYLGSWIMLLLGASILVLSITPVISVKLFNATFDPQSSVAIYNLVAGIWALFMLLIVGLYPYFGWNKFSKSSGKKITLYVNIAVGIIITIIAFFFIDTTFFDEANENASSVFQHIFYSLLYGLSGFLGFSALYDFASRIRNSVKSTKDEKGRFKKVKISLFLIAILTLISICFTALSYFLGLFDIYPLHYIHTSGNVHPVITGIALVILFTIILIVAVRYGNIMLKNGSSLAHLGISLFLIGAVTSGTNSIATGIKSIEQDESTDFLDLEVQYNGYQSTDMENRYDLLIDVKDKESGKEYYISSFPQVYPPDGFSPAIISRFGYDYHLEPKDIYPEEALYPADMVVVEKGTSKEIGSYEITFDSFSASADRPITGHGNMMGANIIIKDNAGEIREEQLFIDLSSGSQSDPMLAQRYVELGDENQSVIYLEQLQPESSSIVLALYMYREKQILMSLQYKPLMSFVWMGAAFMIIGSLISWINRRRIRPAANSDNQEKEAE